MTQLADWLKAKGLTGSDLARLVGCDDATINRLIPKKGKKQVRKPSLDLAEKICEATDGEVTPNDFMDAGPRAAAEEADHEPATS